VIAAFEALADRYPWAAKAGHLRNIADLLKQNKPQAAKDVLDAMPAFDQKMVKTHLLKTVR